MLRTGLYKTTLLTSLTFLMSIISEILTVLRASISYTVNIAIMINTYHSASCPQHTSTPSKLTQQKLESIQEIVLSLLLSVA